MTAKPGDILARATFERSGGTEEISVVQTADGVTFFHDLGDCMPPYKADFADVAHLVAALADMDGIPREIRTLLTLEARWSADA